MVAPQGLQLLKSTEESLLVGWEPSGEVDHYLLSYHPLGKELSGKQIQVPKQQHSYHILGLLPGTKYIVTLRNVKKDVPSSPQHLLATTGEAPSPTLSFTGPHQPLPIWAETALQSSVLEKSLSSGSPLHSPVTGSP